MDYLVLKRNGATGILASEWDLVAIALGVAEGESPEEVAARQGFTGDGRYKAVEWPEAEGSEFDLTAGPPAATPVEAADEAEGS